jgi:hypothetical protein
MYLYASRDSVANIQRIRLLFTVMKEWNEDVVQQHVNLHVGLCICNLKFPKIVPLYEMLSIQGGHDQTIVP